MLGSEKEIPLLDKAKTVLTPVILNYFSFIRRNMARLVLLENVL